MFNKTINCILNMHGIFLCFRSWCSCSHTFAPFCAIQGERHYFSIAISLEMLLHCNFLVLKWRIGLKFYGEKRIIKIRNSMNHLSMQVYVLRMILKYLVFEYISTKIFLGIHAFCLGIYKFIISINNEYELNSDDDKWNVFSSFI